MSEETRKRNASRRRIEKEKRAAAARRALTAQAANPAPQVVVAQRSVQASPAAVDEQEGQEKRQLDVAAGNHVEPAGEVEPTDSAEPAGEPSTTLEEDDLYKLTPHRSPAALASSSTAQMTRNTPAQSDHAGLEDASNSTASQRESEEAGAIPSTPLVNQARITWREARSRAASSQVASSPPHATVQSEAVTVQGSGLGESQEEEDDAYSSDSSAGGVRLSFEDDRYVLVPRDDTTSSLGEWRLVNRPVDETNHPGQPVEDVEEGRDAVMERDGEEQIEAEGKGEGSGLENEQTEKPPQRWYERECKSM